MTRSMTQRLGVAALGVAAVLLWAAPAHAETFNAVVERGWGAAFAFALTAGLLTALTPCVYPMIPITISIFGARTGASRGRAFALATAYVGGIAVMFGSLGTTFALAGKAFGTFLASPWVVVPLALFFALMALSMFGAFAVALPSRLQARLASVGGKGFGGAFLMGLVGGIIAAPCTGPPLAGILAYVATTRDAVFGFLLLATYAAGIGVPFWGIAGFSMSLPRSGPWMESIKGIFGLALLTAALYYLKNVVPPLATLTGRTPAFLAGALGVTLLGVALGAVHLTFHGAVPRRIRKGVGIALATLGLFAVTNYLLTPKGDIALHWHHDEKTAVAEARATGRPMVIDFTADWCLPCRELESQVFARNEVAMELRKLTLLKVDCTREDDDPAIAAIKRKYGADTLPAVRILSASGHIVAKIDEPIGPRQFLSLLSRVEK